MTEHVLITGGGGYIGSILIPKLLAAGYSVTVLDTFHHRVNSLAASCSHPGFQVVRGDCRDEQVVAPLAAKADWIVPLAALVGAPICEADQVNARTINTDAVKMLLSKLSASQRVIFPVTNSGYGIGEAGKFCDENSALRPISLYGRTKVEAEKIVMERAGSISFRLATVFGFAPRMRIDLLVNDFTYRAVRDKAVVIFEGHAKRNYIHVRDVADGFLFAMKNIGTMAGEVFNMGLSEANLSKIELAEKIKVQLPNFTYIESAVGSDPDKRDYIVSNAKLEATGWRPNVSLDAGISELIKGYAMIRNELYSNV